MNSTSWMKLINVYNRAIEMGWGDEFLVIALLAEREKFSILS